MGRLLSSVGRTGFKPYPGRAARKPVWDRRFSTRQTGLLLALCSAAGWLATIGLVVGICQVF
jgi:hypothetical protein